MNILLIGAVEFSAFCLEQLVRCGGRVVGVITQDEPGWNADFVDVGVVAQAHGIPCHRVRRIADSEAVRLIRTLGPDVIFVLGFSQLIPEEVLRIPPKGVIGCHSTLLPEGRGRHPLIWALVKGLTESGTTFFYLDRGVDRGDIIFQKRFAITLEDDAASLYEKDKACAAEIIRGLLPHLERGTVPRMPQDHTRATYWRKRTYEDGIIDWSRPAMDTYNVIRALARPYPGASTYVGSQELKVWKALVPRHRHAGVHRPAPGTVLAVTDATLEVATADAPLTILSRSFVGDAPVVIRSGDVLAAAEAVR